MIMKLAFIGLAKHAPTELTVCALRTLMSEWLSDAVR